MVATLRPARLRQAFFLPASWKDPLMLKLITRIRQSSREAPLVVSVPPRGRCILVLYSWHDRGEGRVAGGAVARCDGRSSGRVPAHGRGLARPVVHRRLHLPAQARWRGGRPLRGGRKARPLGGPRAGTL